VGNTEGTTDGGEGGTRAYRANLMSKEKTERPPGRGVLSVLEGTRGVLRREFAVDLREQQQEGGRAGHNVYPPVIGGAERSITGKGLFP